MPICSCGLEPGVLNVRNPKINFHFKCVWKLAFTVCQKQKNSPIRNSNHLLASLVGMILFFLKKKLNVYFTSYFHYYPLPTVLDCATEARLTFYGDKLHNFWSRWLWGSCPRHMSEALVISLRAIENVLAMFFHFYFLFKATSISLLQRSRDDLYQIFKCNEILSTIN